jgi:hypothetical protein
VEDFVSLFLFVVVMDKADRLPVGVEFKPLLFCNLYGLSVATDEDTARGGFDDRCIRN